MASKRMCPQSVMLYNYVGEVNDRAKYVTTFLHNVRCNSYRGISASAQGRGEADTATLYIFDDILYATDDKEKEVTYMPFEEWDKLADKTGYWTLNPDGNDYFFVLDEGDIKPNFGKRYKILGFRRHKQGSPRMHHFEVNGG